MTLKIKHDFICNRGKTSTNAYIPVLRKNQARLINDVKDHSSFALDQQNGKGNFKLLPSTFRICQSLKIFVLAKEKAMMNNNSLLPGLRKRETGALPLHFLEKHAICLLQIEIKPPRIYRVAAMIDDLKYLSVAKRM